MQKIVCSGCKNALEPEAFALDRVRSTGRRYKCRACSNAEFKRWQQTPGYAERLTREKQKRDDLKRDNPKLRWARHAVGNLRARSKARGEMATITRDWLYENAPDICPLLGIELRYDNATSLADSAAVDRKDSNIGYTPDNCWVISMKANRIKTNATLAELETVVANLRRLNPYAA